MSEWISIEEQLPEIYKDVLVYDVFNFFSVMSYNSASRTWIDGNGSTLNADEHNITHWAYLKEPDYKNR